MIVFSDDQLFSRVSESMYRLCYAVLPSSRMSKTKLITNKWYIEYRCVVEICFPPAPPPPPPPNTKCGSVEANLEEIDQLVGGNSSGRFIKFPVVVVAPRLDSMKKFMSSLHSSTSLAPMRLLLLLCVAKTQYVYTYDPYTLTSHGRT